LIRAVPTSEEVGFVILGHDNISLCLPIGIHYVYLVLRLKPQIAHDILAHFQPFLVVVVNISWGSDSGLPRLLLNRRVGDITILTIEAVPYAIFMDGVDSVPIARDGDNYRTHISSLSNNVS
jgi:hypothetical protein